MLTNYLFIAVILIEVGSLYINKPMNVQEKNDSVPELGHHLSEYKQATTDTNILQRIMVSSSTGAWKYTLIVEGIDYSIGVNNDSLIVYISTKDTAFTSPEGVKVGMRYSDILKTIDSIPLLESGWGYYLSLPSGWSICYWSNSMKSGSYDDNHPILNKEAVVQFFFKRKSLPAKNQYWKRVKSKKE